MAEKNSSKKASVAKKAAAKADTEGHANIRQKAPNSRLKAVRSKAAPAAADTEGHAVRSKASQKR